MDRDLFDFLDNLDTTDTIFDINRSRRPKIYRKRPNYFNDFDEIDFFRRYRLSKSTVIYLLEKIEHILEFPDNRNNSIPPINQLLIALRYYATGNHLLAVADMGGTSLATSSRIVKRVSQAIVSLRREFIIFPDTNRDQDRVKIDFYDIARFPNVLGCIDCTHVKIQSPGGDDAELFRNRKGYMSINVQTIASAKLLVQDVVARWPGSTHDSAIYQNSYIYRKFERGEYGDSHLLGDSGYPLKPHLLTPYLNPTTSGERKYNEAHIRTRNVVERQYGVLKRRFPVLAVGIRLALNNAINVIIACCILHNICILRNEQQPVNNDDVPNLEELIARGQINNMAFSDRPSLSYGFRRNQITQYFDNL
ncbi:unnamed protein product [Parnassius mnemosyne]|uniref:Putative nuclease HARBI1 n=1 Tax=Parnassius mnemosyne TaxID=213953 RepID=A0AAV1MAU7_9NEOP